MRVRNFSGYSFIRFAVAVVFSVNACSGFEEREKRTEVFDFTVDNQGFVAGFTDFHPDQEASVAFLSGRRVWPVSSGKTGETLFHEGNNVSDDLFMYFKQQITDLQPYTRYDLTFTLSLASNVGSDCFSDHVWLKAGASRSEPARKVATDYISFSIDKGNQSQVGSEALFLGTTRHTGEGCNSNDWKLIERKAEVPFAFVSDGEGKAWIWFGSESGFEVAHTLYFEKLTVDFQEIRQ